MGRRRRIWWHWSNENARPGEGWECTGNPIRAGRAWLHVGRFCFGTEWTLFKRSTFGFGVRFDKDDRKILGHLGLGFAALWLWCDPWPRGLFGWKDYGDRAIDFCVHDGALWWELWADPMGGWPCPQGRWRRGSFDPVDFLLGRTRFHELELSKHAAVVPMPERGYPGTVTMKRVWWTRSRWPLRLYESLRGEVDLAVPIPVPGKGENSWDCGDDAIRGQSGPARSAEQAIAKVVESALRTRRRYGGADWRPRAG